jgi:hypothetical protein
MKSNGVYNFPMHLQLHRLEVLGDLEGSGSLTADLLNGDALGVLDQGQTLGGADVEDGQVGDNGRDAARASQGECAVWIEGSALWFRSQLKGGGILPARILGLPFLSVCSCKITRLELTFLKTGYVGKRTIVTTTLVFSGLATRSMAPPIPLTLPGSMKLARSEDVLVNQKRQLGNI